MEQLERKICGHPVNYIWYLGAPRTEQSHQRLCVESNAAFSDESYDTNRGWD